MLRVGGLEVARFVEDIVGGQQHFVLLEEDLPIGEQGGGVGDWLAGSCLGAAYDSRRGWERDLLPARRSTSRLRSRKAGPLEQIVRKIAADAEFGEDGEVGAAMIWPGGPDPGCGRNCRRKSPTVGLNWARAIFMRSYRIRFGRGQFNSESGGGVF